MPATSPAAIARKRRLQSERYWKARRAAGFKPRYQPKYVNVNDLPQGEPAPTIRVCRVLFGGNR